MTTSHPTETNVRPADIAPRPAGGRHAWTTGAGGGARSTLRANVRSIALSDAAWAACVDDDPRAFPEQDPQWVAAACAQRRYDNVSRLYELSDGRRFVVPMIARRGLPNATRTLWSFPNAWGFGGPVGADLDAAAVSAIVADLRSVGALRVALRVDPLQRGAWQHLDDAPGVVTVPRTTHVITNLPDSIESLRQALPAKARSQLRRADKMGVEVRAGTGGDLLHHHYRLFLLSVERWAAQQREPQRLAVARAQRRDPLTKLEAIGRHLGDRFVTIVAFVDGQPAASVILLLGATARYTRNAIDIDLVRPTRANEAAQWHSLVTAVEFGARHYNLGESGTNANLASFKERFGAVALSSFEYRFERLPLTAADRTARRAVKRLIGFRD